MPSLHRSDAVRRTSDAEITRPHNDQPSEPPPLPSWHVHLELQPEELITLHRLGFTGGALAWRVGMPEWQPLRLGEAGIRDARESTESATSEDSLPQPIPLTRRSGSRGTSGSVVALDRPRPFSSSRHTTPPIALAGALNSDRPRPELMLPPPPMIEARGVGQVAANDTVHTLVEPWLKTDHSRSAISAVRDQQPPSFPPLALGTRTQPPRRTPSRALWLGAAALVALSASNGALVSALVWSLRHDASRPAATATARPAGVAARAISARATADAECPAPGASAAAVTATGSSALSNGAGPVSVEQLPLLTSENAAADRTSSEHTRTRSAAAPASSSGAASSASARKSTARAGLAETATSGRRAEATASAATSTSGPIDRGALADAVARAAGAASSCAQGPEKGRVALTFAPSGSVQAAQLEQSFGEPGLNSCVLRAMGRARVRPFSGEAVTVHKTLTW